MRILVYGAGVLGSYLAHELVHNGNEVTMLARGRRADELQQNGNVIRHYLQLRTTVDKVNVIRELQPEDVYDLIFVVMKYPDFEAVLPALAANRSKHIVIMGNNASPIEMRHYLQSNSPVEKKVVFAFQSLAGWRENGRVTCLRGPKVTLAFGGLGEQLNWRSVIDQALKNTRYKTITFTNMDEWLKSHFVMILPLNRIAVSYNGNLRKAAKDKRLLNYVIDAIDEGHQVLRKNGYTITPANQHHLVRKYRKLFFFVLKIILATPIGRTTLSDKAVSSNEMDMLYQAFSDLKNRANMATPSWDKLYNYIPLQ
ncbi:2-dehydropantoate 2-reductase N-terminal domain-containing protein [Paenibacillus sp. ATY16]|uniref:ketopantoate reductase family protein n=1 Tax=Paenibacillus sp. ATY16 TaxID=1759312 RepID=UPI000E2FC071|nr:2-dehydropantoate 2-reductase N-terminal domain-containing protein [Paenibacillus sp. ATY16]MCK9861774.1 NAD-dependent epimerase/dehydratase family protein [Paenibacillus sp. ATY16]